MEPGYRTFVNADSDDFEQINSRNRRIDGATYTVDDVVEQGGFKCFQIKISIIAGLAWVADSMEMMVVSILGPVLMCVWQLTPIQEALITTIVFLGYIIGSPALGWLSDTYGRKKGLVFGTVWSLYYGMLSALSPLYPWLLVLRGLTGFGLAGTPQAVTYYSEFLPSKYRGKSIIFLEVFWALGAAFEVILAMLILENFGWRWWLASSAIPLLLFIPLSLVMPESPRYLVAVGEMDEAKKVLQSLAKCNNLQLPEGRLVNEHQESRAQFCDLLTPEFRCSTLLLWFIWFVTMFSYYGIILMSTQLIQRGTTCVSSTVGPDDSESDVCPAECPGLSQSQYIDLLWTSFAELPGLLLTALYVDYIPRRVALAINLVMYSVSVFLLFICVSSSYLVAILFIARAFIASGLQVLYLYTPEVYPTVFRAVGMGGVNVFARFGAIITPFVAQVLIKVNLGAALLVYGILGILGVVAVIFLPIETKGKHLKTSAN